MRIFQSWIRYSICSDLTLSIFRTVAYHFAWILLFSPHLSQAQESSACRKSLIGHDAMTVSAGHVTSVEGFRELDAWIDSIEKQAESVSEMLKDSSTLPRAFFDSNVSKKVHQQIASLQAVLDRMAKLQRPSKFKFFLSSQIEKIERHMREAQHCVGQCDVSLRLLEKDNAEMMTFLLGSEQKIKDLRALGQKVSAVLGDLQSLNRTEWSRTQNLSFDVMNNKVRSIAEIIAQLDVLLEGLLQLAETKTQSGARLAHSIRQLNSTATSTLSSFGQYHLNLKANYLNVPMAGNSEFRIQTRNWDEDASNLVYRGTRSRLKKELEKMSIAFKLNRENLTIEDVTAWMHLFIKLNTYLNDPRVEFAEAKSNLKNMSESIWSLIVEKPSLTPNLETMSSFTKIILEVVKWNSSNLELPRSDFELTSEQVKFWQELAVSMLEQGKIRNKFQNSKSTVEFFKIFVVRRYGEIPWHIQAIVRDKVNDIADLTAESEQLRFPLQKIFYEEIPGLTENAEFLQSVADSVIRDQLPKLISDLGFENALAASIEAMLYAKVDAKIKPEMGLKILRFFFDPNGKNIETWIRSQKVRDTLDQLILLLKGQFYAEDVKMVVALIERIRAPEAKESQELSTLERWPEHITGLGNSYAIYKAMRNLHERREYKNRFLSQRGISTLLCLVSSLAIKHKDSVGPDSEIYQWKINDTFGPILSNTIESYLEYLRTHAGLIWVLWPGRK
jgi:hypothetical protein